VNSDRVDVQLPSLICNPTIAKDPKRTPATVTVSPSDLHEKGFDLSVPHSFLTGALCEEVRCIAKVGDGYRAIAGAHRYVAVSASRSTSLFPMWWWSFCFSVLEKSCILHTVIAFAALIMKTFLRKHFGNCFRSSQSSTQDEHP